MALAQQLYEGMPIEGGESVGEEVEVAFVAFGAFVDDLGVWLVSVDV